MIPEPELEDFHLTFIKISFFTKNVEKIKPVNKNTLSYAANTPKKGKSQKQKNFSIGFSILVVFSDSY